MIRVLLVDDQQMIRAGLRSLLEREPDVEVVAEAGDGSAALDAARRVEPDVVLMDVRMPVLDGIAATAQLVERGLRARVIVLTTFALDDYVFRALRAGASGFLLKDAPAEDLVHAVRVVAGGDALLDPAVTQRVIEAFAATPDVPLQPPEDDLSPREREVLVLLARGATNREIAETLVVSEATAKTHVSNVLLKLRVRDRVHAVIHAYETGIVRPGVTAGRRRC